MSKKKWNRKVELGGAEPNDYLAQLDAFRRGQVTASDVVSTNVQPEPETTPVPDIPAPPVVNLPYRQTPQNTSVEYLPIPEKKHKKKKDKGPMYKSGDPLIPYGDKRARLDERMNPIPWSTWDEMEPTINSPMPSHSIRLESGYIEIEGLDGKRYVYDTQNNRIVDVIEDEPESVPEVEPSMSDLVKNLLFNDDAVSGYIDDVPRYYPNEEPEQDIVPDHEMDNSFPSFVVEGDSEWADDKSLSYLTIADSKHMFTVKSDYVDLFTLDEDAFAKYLKDHNLEFTSETLLDISKLIITLIITTRNPAISTDNKDEFMSGLNMYSHIDELKFPRATSTTGENKFMLWCASDSFFDALNTEALRYAEIDTLAEVNTEYIKYLLVVLQEAMRMNNAWNCYSTEVITEGFPKDVDMYIASDSATKPIASFNVEHSLEGTVLDYNSYITLREYLTTELLINEDDEPVDDGVMDMLNGVLGAEEFGNGVDSFVEPVKEEPTQVEVPAPTTNTVDVPKVDETHGTVVPPKNFVEMTKNADEVKPETKEHPKTREVPVEYKLVVNDSNHSDCVPAKSVEGEFVVPIIKRR